MWVKQKTSLQPVELSMSKQPVAPSMLLQIEPSMLPQIGRSVSKQALPLMTVVELAQVPQRKQPPGVTPLQPQELQSF